MSSPHAWPSADVLASALQSLTPVAALMTDEISALDQGAVALRLSIGAQDVTGSLRHRLLFDNRTFATYLLYWGDAAAGPLDVSLTLAVAGKPVVQDLSAGADLVAGVPRAVTDYSRDPATGKVHAGVPLTGGPMVVDFNEGAAQVFVARSDVSAARQLSVGEIIARHQQQQRAQDGLVRNYIAVARMEQHFRPTMADPGYDVVTENRYFVAGERRRMGGALVLCQWVQVGRGSPAVPAAAAREGSLAAAAAPVRRRVPLPAGRRRIESTATTATSCGSSRVRQDAVAVPRDGLDRPEDVRADPRFRRFRADLSAPVVSNEEIQKYAPVDDAREASRCFSSAASPPGRSC